MRYPSMINSVITLLIITSELVNCFNRMNLNHRLLKLKKLNIRNVEEKWIEQPLDHDDANEKRTINIRYLENLELWKPNGPIYIFIGGEAEIQPFFSANDDRNFIAHMAKDTNGAMFAMEHRYYGQSLPKIPDDDLIKYYKFLSSKQALADLANFIKMVKADSKFKSSKVVVVGGSYSGNLAAWARELYPDLVDAALASSAPVLAKKDFHEFFDIVGYTLDKYGTENCIQNIEKYFKRIEVLLKSPTGIKTLKQEYSICPEVDMSVLENQQIFFASLYYTIAVSVQTGTPDIVKTKCKNYALGDSPIPDFLNLIPMIRGNENCLNFNFSSLHMTDPWTYQFCTEFGYLQTTSSEKQPFVRWNPLKFVLKYCKDIIDKDIEKRVDEAVVKTNKMYGGQTPKVNKVVFTNGDMDPWHPLSVLSDLGPDAHATVVNGTSHCATLFVYPGESKELVQTREYIKKLIYNWISTP